MCAQTAAPLLKTTVLFISTSKMQQKGGYCKPCMTLVQHKKNYIGGVQCAMCDATFTNDDEYYKHCRAEHTRNIVIHRVQTKKPMVNKTKP